MKMDEEHLLHKVCVRMHKSGVNKQSLSKLFNHQLFSKESIALHKKRTKIECSSWWGVSLEGLTNSLMRYSWVLLLDTSERMDHL